MLLSVFDQIFGDGGMRHARWMSIDDKIEIGIECGAMDRVGRIGRMCRAWLHDADRGFHARDPSPPLLRPCHSTGSILVSVMMKIFRAGLGVELQRCLHHLGDVIDIDTSVLFLLLEGCALRAEPR